MTSRAGIGFISAASAPASSSSSSSSLFSGVSEERRAAAMAFAASVVKVRGAFHCDVCDIGFSSAQQKTDHEQGKKHKKKAGEPVVKGVVPRESKTADPAAQNNAYCEVCEMYFSSDSQLDSHKTGKKHKKKAEAKLLVEDEPESSKRPRVEEPAKPKGKRKEEKWIAKLSPKLARNLTKYKNFFLPLIELELEESMNMDKDRIKNTHIQFLIQSGDALVGLMAFSHKLTNHYKRSPTEHAYRFELPTKTFGEPAPDLPNHELLPGDMVWISNSAVNPSAPGDMAPAEHIEGIVAARGKNTIAICVDPAAQTDIKSQFLKTLAKLREAEVGEEVKVAEQQLDEDEDAASVEAKTKLSSHLSDGQKRLLSALAVGAGSAHWRLDRGPSIIGFERMRDALQDITGSGFNGHPSLRQLFCRLVVKGEKPEIAPEEVAEADEIFGAWQEKKTAKGVPYWYNPRTKQTSNTKPEHPHAHLDPLHDLELDPGVNDYPFPAELERKVKDALVSRPLNDSQRHAIVQTFKHRLSLIQGPPGTGKTTTAVELLTMWARLGHVKGPLFAAAYSNIAVDQLLEGLIRNGVKAVRLGLPTKVRPELRACTLEAQMEAHPEAESIRAELDSLKRLMTQTNMIPGVEQFKARKRITQLRNKLKKREESLAHDVIKSAEVVLATCIGSGAKELNGMKFPLVLVDEATQATEPSCLIPVVQATEQVILIGDQCQLPPTVMSERLKRAGLQVSLFERLLAPIATPEAVSHSHSTPFLLPDDGKYVPPAGGLLGVAPRAHAPIHHHGLPASAMWTSGMEGKFVMGVVPLLLKVQYRMHPLISMWPSRSFYGGALSNGIEAKDRIPPRGFKWPRVGPVAFISVSYPEQGHENATKSNDAEVSVVYSVVNALINAGDVSAPDIGVVTPYSGQVKKIRRVFGLSMRGRSNSVRYDGLEVASVDAYQGREKEVIVFSCVRSNQTGTVGFLADVRRLNVAITRAKRGLIVVGDPWTLRHNPTWNSWVLWAQEHDLLTSPDRLGVGGSSRQAYAEYYPQESYAQSYASYPAPVDPPPSRLAPVEYKASYAPVSSSSSSSGYQYPESYQQPSSSYQSYQPPAASYQPSSYQQSAPSAASYPQTPAGASYQQSSAPGSYAPYSQSSYQQSSYPPASPPRYPASAQYQYSSQPSAQSYYQS